MRLPHRLASGDDQAAIDQVRVYQAPSETLPGGVSHTGSLFDTWDGGGDRTEVRDRFTDADVSAGAMLSVSIPPRAIIELLSRQSGRLSELLAEIPYDLDLHEADATVIGPGSPAWQVWDSLNEIHGIGWVTANKLLARKRPRLLPVYDEVVREVVGDPENFWESLREALQADGKSLARRLRTIGAEAGAPHLSVIRVFDMIAWGTGAPTE